ncbi:MAG: hypothetical protein ABJA64_02600, partial [Candidatus Saccharibacteria bacterium]
MLTGKYFRLTILLLLVLSISAVIVNFRDASAVTSTTTLRPNSDVTATWGVIGTNDGSCGATAHCSLIDESVANDADLVVTGGSNVDEYGLTDVTGGQTATSILLRVRDRAASGFGDHLTPNIRINGTLQTAGDFVPTTTFAWYEKTYTGTWTQAD